MNNTTPDYTQKQLSIADNIKKILSDTKTKLLNIKKFLSDPKTKSLIVDDIKNILNDFNTKLIFIFVSLFVLCNTFITNVIDKYIDRGILSGFNDNIAERILFIVVIAILIYYSRIAIRRNKKVSNAEIEWAVIILLFWAYYRLISIGWTYVKFWNLDFIYYIDIVLLLSLSIFARRLLYKPLEYKPEGSNGFELDLPITKEDEHSLKRDDLAQKLATRIKNTNVKDSAFSIGIESPWGFGKTSFINLLCNHLTDKNTIIIKFNPWNYEKERSLVDAFFVELREALKKYDSSLSTILTQYGNILSHSNHDTIKLSAEFIQCLSSQSINTKRSKIDSAIKAIGKLIIVVIDDLDRLDKDEIISVLKLIRNSANFPNMVFVSAYDKEYLIETLKDDVCNSNKYLEKIFQYQFKLPEIDKSILRTMLYNKFKPFIETRDEEQLKNILGIDNQASQLLFDLILSNIDNIRDVLRFLNSFKFVYQRLKGDTQIHDLLMIELLRMKYYDVYELLSKDHNKYLYDQGTSLVLWNENLDKNSFSKNTHSDIFATIGKKYTADGKDYKKIERLLNGMFDNDSAKIKAINNSYYIDRYFYYSLLDFDISEEEFKKVMNKPYQEIKQHIDVWLDNKKSYYLSDLLRNAKISNIEIYIKVIRSIFYVGYKIGDVFLKVDFVYSVILKSPLTPDENKAFIYEVFFENGASEFVAKFIKDLFSDLLVTSKLNFTAEECHNISAKMLQLACDCNMPFDKVLKFLDYTSYLGHVDDHDGTYHLGQLRSERAYDIFISYVKSNYATVLPQLINKDFENRTFIYISYFDPWNGKEAFMSFVNDLLAAHNDDAMLKEFSEFVTAYFQEGSPIKFDFKYIKFNS